MKALHIITILGCICGSFVLVGTFLTATGALQEGAGAALAVALAVIPCCFVRSVELWAEPSASEAELRKLNETLATHTRWTRRNELAIGNAVQKRTHCKAQSSS
jgi:hypothetical protein